MTSTLPGVQTSTSGPAVRPGDLLAPAGAATPAASAAPGVVTGRPLAWLRAEGLATAVAGVLAYATTGAPWWLVPALFLVPDLAVFGYLAGDRVGAWAYNLAHTAPLPVALLAAGLGWHVPALVVAGATGLVHIGLDRALGYGVKYDSGFGHTHLGATGPAAR